MQADYFYSFSTQEELLWSLENKPEKQLCLILGGGSNIVFTSDVNGVVLHNAMQGITAVDESDGSVLIEVAGGVEWHSLVQWSIQRGYAGLENLSLIPGTVGAAPIQNIGAYGVELCDVFESLEAVEIKTGKCRQFNKLQCDFAYRHSVFKTLEYRGKWVITSVMLKLRSAILNTAVGFQTGYGEIEAELARRNVTELSPQIMSDVVVSIRRRKLPDPADLPNVGSFFKNPIVSDVDFQRIQQQHPGMVNYTMAEQRVKLAAGWMIDSLGWKGREMDGAKVHDKQALVLINAGGGGQAVVNLSECIQKDVVNSFGVFLEPEPLILGAFK